MMLSMFEMSKEEKSLWKDSVIDYNLYLPIERMNHFTWDKLWTVGTLDGHREKRRMLKSYRSNFTSMNVGTILNRDTIAKKDKNHVIRHAYKVHCTFS